jgi:E3 ubiquitin-protein ligase NEDD4
MQFAALANQQTVMVICPPGASPGCTIQITAPPAPRSRQGQQAVIVRVPDGVRPGDPFQVQTNGRFTVVTCPGGVSPGDQVQVMVPAPKPTIMQTFEVSVPEGVRPGQPFALVANGQRLMVTCPPTAGPGQVIRFQLPVSENNGNGNANGAKPIRYEKEVWVRCLGNDQCLQWVKQDAEPSGDEGAGAAGGAAGGAGGAGGGASEEEAAAGAAEGAVEAAGGAGGAADPPPPSQAQQSNQKRGFPTEAFVRSAPQHGRKLTFLRAEDARLPLEDAPAHLPAISIGYNEIAFATEQGFKTKVEWFREQSKQLAVPWEHGHIKINVRRGELLEDCVAAFTAIEPADMHKIFRFEFLGEAGLDAGGVAREFYELVSERMFNADLGLFQHSGADQMAMNINPSSGMVHEEHLTYFRAAGRVMGKALFDGHIIKAHLVRPLYKHILGWPCAFKDLEQIDSQAFAGYKCLVDLEDVSCMALDFTAPLSDLQNLDQVPIVPGGADMDVTNDNLSDYYVAMMKFKMLDRISEQVEQVLLGFYEIIPEVLISVFDHQELELLLCGLPEIDLADWKQHTEYVGEYSAKRGAHQVIQWFWSVVEDDFEDEQRARLLQFVTGTSGVPVQGFCALQGNQGVQRFTVNGTKSASGGFPKSHTCFNRIDLPCYKTRNELQHFLTLAITMEATGFGME